LEASYKYRYIEPNDSGSKKKPNMFQKMISKITPDELKKSNSTSKKDPKILALARPAQEIEVSGTPGQQVKLEWELRNESEIKWPKNGTYLRNHCED
jgi:hypothetical protein